DAVFQLDPVEEPPDVGFIQVARHDRLVDPFHPVPRVEEPVRDVALVREQEEPLALHVEASHVEEPPVLLGNQVINGRPTLRIGARGNVTPRLVEREPDRPGQSDGPSVHVDPIPLGIDARAQLGDDLAVDAHAALPDHLLGRAPRGDAGAGEEFLEPHRTGHVAPRAAGQAGPASSGAASTSGPESASDPTLASAAASPSGRVLPSGAAWASGPVWPSGPVPPSGPAMPSDPALPFPVTGPRSLSTTGSSSGRGRSSRERNPKCSRNRVVVPYSTGLPSPAPLPTGVMSSRSWSVRSTPAEPTPRISSISARPIGWR